jgi:hypothetical protein
MSEPPLPHLVDIHLGHLKSYYAGHPYSLDPDTDEGKEISDMQEKLRSTHLELLNFALEEGYAFTFTRWNSSIVNTLIPKDTGSSKIHRLRVIHLYEADYTLILGVK